VTKHELKELAWEYVLPFFGALIRLAAFVWLGYVLGHFIQKYW